MTFSGLALVTLVIFWFVIYWVVGGAIFALISLSQVMRIRNGRFSCLFTIFSLLFAYGAAWMGLAVTQSQSPTCLTGVPELSSIVPALVHCGGQNIGSAALMWGALLLAAGLVTMILTRTSSNKR